MPVALRQTILVYEVYTYGAVLLLVRANIVQVHTAVFRFFFRYLWNTRYIYLSKVFWATRRAVGGGGGYCVHRRSRISIDPRIPTTPGQSTVGFHQAGRHCLHQARSAVRRSASRMKGELHSSKNRS